MIRAFGKEELLELSRKFSNAKPFQHVIVENFLTSHKKVLSGLKKEKFIMKDSDLFSFRQTGNLHHASRKEVKTAVKMLSSPEFASILSKITRMQLHAGAIDVFGALYRKTDYLLCHDDRLEGRKVAFVLYLSESFGKKDGGALTLLSSKAGHPGKKIIAYPPLENSLAIFKVSRKSWHEVEEVTSGRERYTISGWLH